MAEPQMLHISGEEVGLIKRKGPPQSASEIMQDALAEQELARTVQRFLRDQQK